ncbi:hypothetical protein C8R44DRAFT_740180 [Mycena epipterygia]|nr:hypothetical protein C8R44DRAFT_740180 [Mycena epipterygia]
MTHGSESSVGKTHTDPSHPWEKNSYGSEFGFFHHGYSPPRIRITRGCTRGMPYNGHSVEHVNLVGQLASFKYMRSLRVGVFEIYDGSGNIEAWLYGEERNMPAMEKHVFGRLKNSGGLIHVRADAIKPVKDVNQVYFHILHTIYTYVALQIGPPTSKSELGTANTLPGSAQVAPIQVTPSLLAPAITSKSSVYMAPSNAPLVPTLFSPLATTSMAKEIVADSMELKDTFTPPTMTNTFLLLESEHYRIVNKLEIAVPSV